MPKNIKVYRSPLISPLDGIDAGRLAIDRGSIPHAVVNSSKRLLNKYLGYIEFVENLSPKTIDNRKFMLGPFLKRIGHSEVTDITLYEIDDYCIVRRGEIKASSLNSERQAIRGFFSYCQTYLLLELQFDYRSIRRTKEHPPKILPITRTDVARVVLQTKHRQDQLIITTMFETGMRIGELINLCIEDIRDTQIQIRGKGSKDRLVIMPGQLATAIREYCMERKQAAGRVFRPLQSHYTYSSEMYTSAYAIRDRIQREFMRCGIKMHPHQLRHSFAVNWLQNSGDIRTLQLLLGHESLETTQRYLGISDNYMNEVYQKTIPKSIIS
jgi:site-specific recombinase XerD